MITVVQIYYRIKILNIRPEFDLDRPNGRNFYYQLSKEMWYCIFKPIFPKRQAYKQCTHSHPKILSPTMRNVAQAYCQPGNKTIPSNDFLYPKTDKTHLNCLIRVSNAVTSPLDHRGLLYISTASFASRLICHHYIYNIFIQILIYVLVPWVDFRKIPKLLMIQIGTVHRFR